MPAPPWLWKTSSSPRVSPLKPHPDGRSGLKSNQASPLCQPRLAAYNFRLLFSPRADGWPETALQDRWPGAIGGATLQITALFMRSRLGGVMRTPRILLVSTFRRWLHWPNFASPGAALLALLALLGWPLTACAQWSPGAGAQSPPAPAAQQAPPAAGDQQAASAQRSLPAPPTQQPLTA
jgi:hypothetical protein